MAKVFNESDKARLVSGGTDNHLLLIEVTDFGMTGKQAEQLLDTVSITVNKNSIPFEKLSPFQTSGIRIGSPAITSRGFDEESSAAVAKLILKVLENSDNEEVLAEVKKEVIALTDAHPLNIK